MKQLFDALMERLEQQRLHHLTKLEAGVEDFAKYREAVGRLQQIKDLRNELQATIRKLSGDDE